MGLQEFFHKTGLTETTVESGIMQMNSYPSWGFPKRLLILLFSFGADPGNRTPWTHPVLEQGGVRQP